MPKITYPDNLKFSHVNSHLSLCASSIFTKSISVFILLKSCSKFQVKRTTENKLIVYIIQTAHCTNQLSSSRLTYHVVSTSNGKIPDLSWAHEMFRFLYKLYTTLFSVSYSYIITLNIGNWEYWFFSVSLSWPRLVPPN